MQQRVQLTSKQARERANNTTLKGKHVVNSFSSMNFFAAYNSFEGAHTQHYHDAMEMKRKLALRLTYKQARLNI
jgi:hypothetical protein